MKKIIIVTLFLTWGCFKSFCSPVGIPMQIINKSASSSGPTYAPPRPWYIMQDDYTLTLPAFDYAYSLVLLDEDGVVVYSADYSAGTSTAVIPSTIFGEFELRLVPYAATYYYRGYIELSD